MTEAKKNVSNKELDTVVNYMVLSFGYDCNFCVPYKDGAKIIAKMEKAEKTARYFNGDNLQFEKEALKIDFYAVTQKDYRKAKIKLLLGIEDGES